MCWQNNELSHKDRIFFVKDNKAGKITGVDKGKQDG